MDECIRILVPVPINKQKGQEDKTIDEVAITDDYGDYLLKKGIVTKEEYDRKQEEAKEILREWGGY